MEEKKKRFFSLDDNIKNSLPVKDILETGKSLVANLIRLPKMPITTLDQALRAWSVDNLSPKELEAFRTRRLTYGVIAGILFCCTLFLSSYNFYVGTFGLLSLVGYAISLYAIATQALIFFWQADMLAGEPFLPFVSYVVRRKWLFACIGIVLAGINDCSAALALPEISYPDLDTTVPDDLSSNLVKTLIGTNWATFGIAAQESEIFFGFGMMSVLLPILGILNTIAIFFISTFAVYIYSFGSVQIARSGRWEDSQIFSTFWSPLRTVASLALCTPLQSGLSALHYLILLCIALSISMANNVTKEFVDYLGNGGNNGSALFRLSPPVVEMGETTYTQFFKTLLGVVCIQKALTNVMGDKIEEPFKVYTKTEKVAVSYDAIASDIINKKVSHTISFSTSESAQEGERYEKYKLPQIIIKVPDNSTDDWGIVNKKVNIDIQKDEVIKLYKKLAEIADTYIAEKMENRGNTANLRSSLQNASREYINNISANARDIMTHDPETIKVEALFKKMTSQSDGAFTRLGWMTLGVYPFLVAQAQGKIQEAATTRIAIEGGIQPDEVARLLETNAEFLIVGQFYADVIKEIRSLSAESGKTPVGNIEKQNALMEILKYIQSIPGMPIKNLAEDLQKRNPIAVLYSKGQTIMTVSAVAITAVGAAHGLGDFLGSIFKKKSGSTQMIGEMMKGAAAVWAPLLTMGLGMLLLFGAGCCYLLPLIPMLFWARAIVSWAVMLVQTLMGAPFWAAVHILPEGTGFAGQHARRGYMMLLDLFTRPTLLCCSIIMSMLLLETIAKILGIILERWADITATAAGYCFLGYLVLFILFVYVIYQSIKWLFIEAIGNFPTKVIRWCGGQSISDDISFNATQSSDLIAGQFKKMVGGLKEGMSGLK